MEIINNNRDLGELKINTSYTFKNELINNSNLPINITLIQPSCGSCTIAHVEKTNLFSLEGTTLVYTFTPNSTGFNSKRINIVYNENSISVTITLNFTAQVIN